MDRQPPPPPPHVVMFPAPALGHVNPMLKLAELLCLSDLTVTFITTEHYHRRLLRNADAKSRFSRFGRFKFVEMYDGFPPEQQRSEEQMMAIFKYLTETTRDVIEKVVATAAEEGSPVTCIIADGIMAYLLGIGEDIGIPVIAFRTVSAGNFWIYFCISQMIEAGELPIQGSEDMDRLITTVPGMESFLRYRDLPSFCRVTDVSDPLLRFMVTQTQECLRARGLILNTFEALESSIGISNIRTQYPKVYAVGPIHAHLKSRLVTSTRDISLDYGDSHWEADQSSLAWLDKQSEKSVIYISIGSIAVLKEEELIEFWHGLVNSKFPFLWVMRPGSVKGHTKFSLEEDCFPEELKLATKERGCIVEWAPQEEVLAHPAVGGFLTHSGWNSTLESIVAGVPMVCWPYFADQQVNSRLVSEVWNLGVDMKDRCDRAVVESMITDLMVHRRKEFADTAADKAKLAREAVSEGGSSWDHMDRLIDDIKSMNLDIIDRARKI